MQEFSTMYYIVRRDNKKVLFNTNVAKEAWDVRVACPCPSDIMLLITISTSVPNSPPQPSNFDIWLRPRE